MALFLNCDNSLPDAFLGSNPTLLPLVLVGQIIFCLPLLLSKRRGGVLFGFPCFAIFHFSWLCILPRTHLMAMPFCHFFLFSAKLSFWIFLLLAMPFAFFPLLCSVILLDFSCSDRGCSPLTSGRPLAGVRGWGLHSFLQPGFSETSLGSG